MTRPPSSGLFLLESALGIPYHVHALPTASTSDISAGISDTLAVTPLGIKPLLDELADANGNGISPYRFDAIGGGLTDDAAALEACRDFCVANNVPMLLDDYFLHEGEFQLNDPITILGVGRGLCGIKVRTDAQHPGIAVRASNCLFQDFDAECWSSASIGNGEGTNATCFTIGIWIADPAGPAQPEVRNTVFNRVSFLRTSGSGGGHAISVMSRSRHVYFNECDWDGPGFHGDAILTHWGAHSNWVSAESANPPLVQAVFEPGHYSYHPNNVYVRNARVRCCARLASHSSSYAISWENIDYVNSSRGGQAIDLSVGDEGSTFADPDEDAGKVYTNMVFRNIICRGHSGNGAGANTTIDLSGLSRSKQTDGDLLGYSDSSYDDDPFGGKAQPRYRQVYWDNILFENIQYDCGPADPPGAVLPTTTIYIRNFYGNVSMKNITALPRMPGLIGLSLSNVRGRMTFEDCDFTGGVSISAAVGVTFKNCRMPMQTFPIYTVPLDYKLTFDGGTGAFTVGQVVTSSTGASGTISAKTGTTSSGTLTLTGVSGTFTDNRAITDPLGGAATTNIPTAFRFGDFVTDGVMEGYIIEVLESDAVRIQVTNGWDDFDAAAQLTSTRGEVQDIGAGAQAMATNDNILISGTTDTVYLGANLAANAKTLTIATELGFDTQTGNFTVGQVVTGGTSGASATIVHQTDSGSSGTLRLGPITLGAGGRNFENNELITDPITGSALVNISSNIQHYSGLAFDAQTVNFAVGNTVTGATSGASMVVVAMRDNGTTGILVGTVTSGPFQDNENLQVSAATRAVANIPSGVSVITGFPYVGQTVNLTAGGAAAGTFSLTTCTLEAVVDNGTTGVVYVSGITPGPVSSFVDGEYFYDTGDGYVVLSITTGLGGLDLRLNIGQPINYSGGVLYLTKSAEPGETVWEIEPAPAAATATAGVALLAENYSHNISFDNCVIRGGLRGANIEYARGVRFTGGSIRDCGQYGIVASTNAIVFVEKVEFGNNGWRRLLPGESSASTRDVAADSGATLFMEKCITTEQTYTANSIVLGADVTGGAIRDNIVGDSIGTDVAVTNPQTAGGWCVVDNNRDIDGVLDTSLMNSIGFQSAQPASGSVVMSAKAMNPYHQLTFTLTAVRLTVTDAGVSGSSASLKLFDFHAGAVQMLGSRHTWSAVVEGAALTGGANDAAFVVALGSVAANAGDGALTGTEVDFGATKSITLPATGLNETTVTGVQTPLDGTNTAVDIYLNWSGTAATIDANSTIDLTGTITINVMFLADD